MSKNEYEKPISEFFDTTLLQEYKEIIKKIELEVHSDAIERALMSRLDACEQEILDRMKAKYWREDQ